MRAPPDSETCFPSDERGNQAANLYQGFEFQAKRHPDAIAVTYRATSITYRDLDSRARNLAAQLQREGVTTESLVAICADRSIEYIVAILAVLKAGGAYVPLDPGYPMERLKDILDETRAPILLTQRPANHIPDRYGGRRMFIDDLKLYDGWDPSTSEVVTAPENLAYVIFTSGSTGRPKGVMVEHRNVLSLLRAGHSLYGINEADTWSGFHSFSFDVSVWEIWGALFFGGRLVVADRETILSPSRFYNLLSDEGVSILSQTPSAFYTLMRHAIRPEIDHLKSLRWIVFGGEALHPNRLRPWLDKYGDDQPKLANMYGITETCVHSTYRRIRIGDTASPCSSPVGRPIPGWKLRILDEGRQEAHESQEGEIYIGGDGVARGYFMDPDLTAERFLQLPDDPDTRYYKSGDWARASGPDDVEYHGRLDHQVQVRGHRIELMEVESRLLQMGEIQSAAVFACDSGEDRYLAALFTPETRAPAIAEKIKHNLGFCLPDYMIPTVIREVAELPHLPNGKIDRARLPEVLGSLVLETPQSVESCNATERMLVGLWEEVLGVARAGLQDNFFLCGGHSLRAMRLASEIEAIRGRQVPIQVLFERPTPELLAEWLDTGEDGASCCTEPLALGATSTAPGVSSPPELHSDLSPGEQWMWFLQQTLVSDVVYNEPFAIRLKGPLDVERLRECWSKITKQHEILRTAFPSVNGIPRRHFLPVDVPGMSLTFFDMTHHPEDTLEQDVGERMRHEARRPFDMTRGPLARATLLQLAEEEHILLMTCHHIICDEHSFRLIFAELGVLYSEGANQGFALLDPLGFKHARFAEQQWAWLHSAECGSALDYWTRALDGANTTLALANDFRCTDPVTGRGASLSFDVAPNDLVRLRNLAHSEAATSFMTLLAVYGLLLSRQTSQSDLVIGSPVSLRHSLELQKPLGYFLNMLPLRLEAGGAQSFREFLRSVRRTVLDAIGHHQVPVDRIAQALAAKSALGRSSLYRTAFVLLPHLEMEGFWRGFTLERLQVSTCTSKFDLTLYATEEQDRLDCVLEYSTDLLAESSALRLIDHFRWLLSRVARQPDAPMDEIETCSPQERHLVTRVFSHREAAYSSDATIPALFEAQARRHPDRTALLHSGNRLSYLQLEAKANGMAQRLRAEGVERGDLVATAAVRSADFVVVVLGILKAGCAYLPLDPSHPRERLLWMLEHSRSQHLIGHEGFLNDLAGSATTGVQLHRIGELPETTPSLQARTICNPMDRAYVMYTSGSTGRPKGIEITHRGVVRLVNGQNYVPLSPDLRTILLAPTSFDASTFELFAPLLNGGTCVVSSHRPLDFERLEVTIRGENVNCVWLTSTLFNSLVDERPQVLKSVDHVITGGEALSVRHVHRALECLPNTQITNAYGPTEGTTFTCTYPVPRDFNPSQYSVPIGKPLANTEVYILSSKGAPTPIGVPGELHIGGDGLALGYLHEESLTAERFISNPLDVPYDPRLYKTGDLARWREDGNIEFLGRLDSQVKIRGFRVELAEIEARLTEHAAVRRAAVILDRDPVGNRLFAYVVRESDVEPDPLELTAHLRKFLPEAMIPAGYHFVSDLPVTLNGKLDRDALTELPRSSRHATAGLDHAAPRCETEMVVIEAFRDLLARGAMGIDENFFDLGGDSLLAVRLVVEITARTGVRLAPHQVFRDPTVEGLSEIIARRHEESSEPVIVEIQQGSGLPVFCLWGLNCFRELARSLGPQVQVYGMYGPWNYGPSESQAECDIVNVAGVGRQYVELIRTKQPQGPYHLVGHSFGGVLAVEVARQLRQVGETIQAVVLLDCVLPQAISTPLSRRISGHLSRFREEGWSYLWSRVKNRLKRTSTRNREDLCPAGGEAKEVVLDGMGPVTPPRRAQLIKAMRAYSPAPVDFPVVLVRASGTLHMPFAKVLLDYGWGPFCQQPLSIVDTTGTHMSMLAKTDVLEVATAVRAHIST